jgi:glycolate oxidase FAD binding subunit
VAYPSGQIAKAGGLVVKNVTGFDLMRLHHGALGTLGVIVSANFKVLPAARHEASLFVEVDGLAAALDVARSVRARRARPAALEVYGSREKWTCAVRIEGRAETVELGLRELRHEAGWSVPLHDAASKQWWQDYVDRQIASMTSVVVTRFGEASSRTGELVATLQATFLSHDISPEYWTVSPELGEVIVRFEAGRDAPGLLRRLQEMVPSMTVLSAPIEVKREIDVWGRVPTSIGVMRTLKREFDPNNILNPGRFVDRI